MFYYQVGCVENSCSKAKLNCLLHFFKFIMKALNKTKGGCYVSNSRKRLRSLQFFSCGKIQNYEYKIDLR